MSDTAGSSPEERLPATRPENTPAPVERFSAPPSTHQFALTPDRAAAIVRQSSSARWVGFLAVLIVVVFVILYYFYDLGFPGIPNSSREVAEANAQQVTSVEAGYNLFEANCARCHGAAGQGGIGPVLNDQAKLFVHLSPTYITNVLTVGGRYVCGNPKSLMPVWADTNGGPLNYVEIQNLIDFIRAPNTLTYTIRDGSTLEPILDANGKPETAVGWRDPNYEPAPNATPVPDCWSSALTSVPAASGPAVTPAPGETVVKLDASNILFTQTSLTGPANTAFDLQFDNQDAGVPHNVVITDTTGKAVFTGDIFNGPATQDYSVPALAAGTYTFHCAVHPTTMTGTITIK
ncbi:MAG: cupredoxin domain-containing protein [Candidatus Limnocylindrales bacterium]